MESPGLLFGFAAALFAALVAGMVCMRLRQPALVGYLLAGVAIGPYGLGLVHDQGVIRQLGDLGVVLLMFALGVEFSIARFRPLKRLVFFGGGLYIAGCIALGALGGLAVGLPLPRGVLAGELLALSSTIIVMRVLIDKHAVESMHGKAMLGWLILQDLAVVPMLVLMPYMASPGRLTVWALVWPLARMVGFLAVMVVLGSRLYPWVFGKLAQAGHKELLFLGVIAVCLGTAAASAACGMSLALGAFLAGLAIGQSDAHHQILAEVLPIRDLFVTLFFVSIGMLLDPSFMEHHLPQLAGIVALVIVAKALLGTGLALALKLSPRAALLIGLGLAQIGEFSFVLAEEGRGVGLVTPTQFSLALAAALVTMLLTPALMRLAGPLAGAVARVYRGQPAEPEGSVEERPENHVIIVGYGRVGQQLGRVLRPRGTPFLVVDLDRALLRRLAARGYHTLFGDGAMREVLDHAGLATARLLVVALPDPSAARLVVAQATEVRPDLEVVAIAQRADDMQALKAMGQVEVVQADVETGAALMRATLVRLGWSPILIHGFMARLRSQVQLDLAEDGDGLVELSLQELTRPPADSEAIWLNLDAESHLVGQTLAHCDLRRETGLTVLALRRGARHILHPGGHHTLREGDALLVLGSPEQLQTALSLLQGLTASPASGTGPA